MFRLSVLLLTIACTPGESTVDLPTVWGPYSAADADPSDDTVEVHLTASKTQVDWAGDQETRGVWAYNGVVPGPLIHAMLGQRIRVVFTNDLPDETTIHWHGLRIDDAMDGVPAIQDPVQPGDTFIYTFTPPDAGTYWYHPHVRAHEQVERGLHGSLIVHEPEAPEVANDRMFVLDDVSVGEDARFTEFEIGHMASVRGRFGNLLLANGENILNEPLRDSVRPGIPERWRIVNTANARTMWIDVTGADWRVIAVDGTLLEEPYTTDMARLPVGRRFDLEVIPKADAKTAKLRILLPGEFDWDSYPVFSGAVEGEVGDAEWLSWPAPVLPAIPDAQQEIDVELDAYSEGSLAVWTINGDRYGEHSDIIARGNTPTVIRIVDRTQAQHPFHLHGQFFRVLSRTGSEQGPPGLLDTILVEPEEELLLATELDNPGRWMAHCHILEHAEQGMMTEMVVEP